MERMAAVWSSPIPPQYGGDMYNSVVASVSRVARTHGYVTLMNVRCYQMDFEDVSRVSGY